MKVGVDIQALQSADCKGRGIGRYVEAVIAGLIRHQSPIEYQFYANPTLSSPSLDMSSLSCQWIDYPQPGRHGSNDVLMKTALLVSDIEAILLPSPLMGVDSTVPDLTGFARKVFAICYDLIPLLFSDRYLTGVGAHADYDKRLNNLRYADLVFAISESARLDVINHLNVAPEKVVNISSGVSEFFRSVQEEEHPHWRQQFAEKFNITRPFIMYTGGEDWRKNLHGLVEAFGLLPPHVRDDYQLVIACRISQGGVRELNEAASRLGLTGSLVLTNFVSDEELRALYSLCHLFVFPSLYEGFGLPVLEAMACGAPALAGNNSSLPEIIGNPHQLFDSGSTASIAAAMQTILTDTDLRDRLAAEAPCRAALFTWENVAQRVEEAMLRSHRDNPLPEKTSVTLHRSAKAEDKGRLAFFSPFRPVRSGISDYSENILPALREHFALDLYHDASYQPDSNSVMGLCPQWSFSPLLFESYADARDYEAIIYQVGNSELHAFVYAALMRYAGVTVLHDYNLSGLVRELSSRSPELGITLQGELQHNYGAERASEIMRLLQSGQLEWTDFSRQEIFINRRVFTRSLGVIVHNRWAYGLAVRDFQNDCDSIAHIPLVTPRVEVEPAAHGAIRRHLGIPQDAFLVSSFGIVGHTKRPAAILNAFAAYSQKHPRAHLAFVGYANPSDTELIRKEVERFGLGGRVHLTGFTEMGEFCRYIQASDVCLNLRFPYNGETSAALLQLFAYGRPTIVTDIGSFSEFPDDVVLKIPQPGTGDEAQEIHDALTALTDSPERRRRMGCNATEYAVREHSPEHCASLYAKFIQDVLRSPSARRKMLADYVGREAVALKPDALAALMEPVLRLISEYGGPPVS